MYIHIDTIDETKTNEISICRYVAKLFTRYYNHTNKQICM